MARVFVSHAGKDRALAGALRQWLSGQEYDVFLAEDLRDGIAVGEQWQRRLHERLRPFDTGWRRVFFGRTGEVGQLAGLLRSPAERADGAVLLVVGPSGCGKSSLVRAGLLPVMADEPGWWTLPPIVLGADPVVALVRELANAAGGLDLSWNPAYVRDQLDEEGLTGLADELLLVRRSKVAETGARRSCSTRGTSSRCGPTSKNVSASRGIALHHQRSDGTRSGC